MVAQGGFWGCWRCFCSSRRLQVCITPALYEAKQVYFEIHVLATAYKVVLSNVRRRVSSSVSPLVAESERCAKGGETGKTGNSPTKPVADN